MSVLTGNVPDKYSDIYSNIRRFYNESEEKTSSCWNETSLEAWELGKNWRAPPKVCQGSVGKGPQTRRKPGSQSMNPNPDTNSEHLIRPISCDVYSDMYSVCCSGKLPFALVNVVSDSDTCSDICPDMYLVIDSNIYWNDFQYTTDSKCRGPQGTEICDLRDGGEGKERKRTGWPVETLTWHVGENIWNKVSPPVQRNQKCWQIHVGAPSCRGELKIGTCTTHHSSADWPNGLMGGGIHDPCPACCQL